MFLAIGLGGMSGLDIASLLGEGTGVVSTAAYQHYACDGFGLDAANCLHKPFSFERFRKAVEKALRHRRYTEELRGRSFITVKQEYNNVTINLDEILYIEVMEGYSKIYRQSGVIS